MSQNSSGGLGLSTVLGVVFIVLKLCGVITWSWWWVLSPFWIGLALILLVVGLLILVRFTTRFRKEMINYEKHI